MSDARISTAVFSFNSSKLNRQPPVAGFGWVTMFWIFAFAGRHDTAQDFRIDRFQPLAGDVEHEDRGVVASAPMPVRENRASEVDFGASGPQCRR